MPQTAEHAHAVAKQFYRAMLACVDSGRDLQAATAAACFQNACALAQMYELRNIRIALMRIAGPDRTPPAGWLGGDDDTHDLHPAPPRVPHDGYAVPGRRFT